MLTGFLPGKPNDAYQSVATVQWHQIRLIVYSSGNNIIILGDLSQLLQTIYLPRDATCVAIQPDSGKIAAAVGNEVFIFKPSIQRLSDLLKWDQERCILISPLKQLSSVRWGINDKELFIAGDQIALFNISDKESRLLWSQSLANPVACFDCSHDGAYLASVSQFDRLVKVWRRLSFDPDYCDFDFTYIVHPCSTISLRWRLPEDNGIHQPPVLYTYARDSVMRTWSIADHSSSNIFQLSSSIDLQYAIDPSGKSQVCCWFLLDRSQFLSARKWGDLGDGDAQQLAVLDAFGSGNAEFLFVFDKQGAMAVWGIDNVGSYNLVCTFQILRDMSGLVAPESLKPHNVCEAFICPRSNKQKQFDLKVLIKDYGTDLRCYSTPFQTFLDAIPAKKSRFRLDNIWTGHTQSIQKITRSRQGGSLVTTSNFQENTIWRPLIIKNKNGNSEDDHTVLERIGTCYSRTRVIRALPLAEGRFLVTLHDDHVCLWDCNSEESRLLTSQNIDQSLKGPECLLLLPESDTSDYKVITVYRNGQGVLWVIKPLDPPKENAPPAEIVRTSRFSLPTTDPIYKVSVIDPVGWEFTLSKEFLDAYQKDIIATVTEEGLIENWAVRINASDDSTEPLQWLCTSRVQTGISKVSLAAGSSIRKIAIVDSYGTGLSLWDTRTGYLEFKVCFSTNTVKDLDWTCTPDSQSILAVGLQTEVQLFCQMRYDYVNKTPAWANFKVVDISPCTTHPIGDSIWISNGTLVVGSGNQMFIYNRKVEDLPFLSRMGITSGSIDDLFTIVSFLNGPLVYYHPQFLTQLIFAGKLDKAEQVLINLHKELKYRDTPEKIATMDLSLGLQVEDFIQPPSTSETSLNGFMAEDDTLMDDSEAFGMQVVQELNEALTKVRLPYLGGHQQMSLSSIISSIAEVHRQRRSIDENGSRFLLGFYLHLVRRDPTWHMMHYRDFVWAYHSESQDVLTGLLLEHFENRLLWQHAKETGICMWQRSREKLLELFESLARNHFVEGNHDPVKCSLYYLALKKKQVLYGLWRTAVWDKDQQKMLKFLNNDFTKSRWKTAALKNAYALLGKQKFEYAAAFFLLGDSLVDAVGVITKNLDDVQLALSVARVYEGDDGPVYSSLLAKDVLRLAHQRSDRWLASWALWANGKKSAAVQVLISPLDDFLSQYDSGEINGDDKKGQGRQDVTSNRSFLVDDPVLCVLYRELRMRSLQALEGASGLAAQLEFNFVSRVAQQYSRMGCDILALDLVRYWKFFSAGKIKAAIDALNKDKDFVAHRRSSSITHRDFSNTKPAPEGRTDDPFADFKRYQSKITNDLKPPPAAFTEPDMSAFDFGA